LQLAQAIPEAGAEFTLPDGTRLQVVEASQRRVRRVRLWPPPKKPSEDEESA
ncbi:MAG: HlyC/CorC family transporter, partial [Myxococcales bacterium]